MSNVAYTDKYKQHWNDSQSLFVAENRVESKEYHLSDEYSVHATKYFGQVGEYYRYGSECSLVDCSGNTVHTWRSIDNRSDFHKIIAHSNGKEYLIFRQDLYGYSVLDIASEEVLQFFPKDSLDGGETFIWTDVEYCSDSNTLAVGGCYWAAPSSVCLFTFDEPMCKQQKFIDLMDLFDHNYEACDKEVDFVMWSNGNLHIKILNTETSLEESMVITQNDYQTWLHDKGKEL